jgi:hypothetical protein
LLYLLGLLRVRLRVGLGHHPHPVWCAVFLFHTVLHLDETVRLVSVIRQSENDRLLHFVCKLLIRLANVVSDPAFSTNNKKPERTCFRSSRSNSRRTSPGASRSSPHLDLRLRFFAFLGEALREAAAVFSTAKSSSFAPALSFSRSQRG